MENEFEDILNHRRAVQANIEKAFGTEAMEESIQKAELSDFLEKGKWNIGDEKVYQGVTYFVGGFNAKGTPLWKKKKDQSGGGAAASTAKQPAPKKDDKPIVSGIFKKAVEGIKRVMPNISDSHLDEIVEKMKQDEETAKKFMSIKFPRATINRSGIEYVKLNDSEILEIVTRKEKTRIITYNGRVDTEYYIRISENGGSARQIGSGETNNWQPDPNAEKDCVMRALYNYFNDKKNDTSTQASAKQTQTASSQSQAAPKKDDKTASKQKPKEKKLSSDETEAISKLAKNKRFAEKYGAYLHDPDSAEEEEELTKEEIAQFEKLDKIDWKWGELFTAEDKDKEKKYVEKMSKDYTVVNLTPFDDYFTRYVLFPKAVLMKRN